MNTGGGGYLRGEWIPAGAVTSRMLADAGFRPAGLWGGSVSLRFAYGEPVAESIVGYHRCAWCGRLYQEKRTQCSICGGGR